MSQRASATRAPMAPDAVAALLGAILCAASGTSAIAATTTPAAVQPTSDIGAPRPADSMEDIRDIRGPQSVPPRMAVAGACGWWRRARARHLWRLASAAPPAPAARPIAVRTGSAAPRGRPSADAAAERSRVLHRGLRHRSQLHRARISTSPPPTEPRKNFCAICSNSPTQRWPAIARCCRNFSISAISSNSRACHSPCRTWNRCATARAISCAQPPGPRKRAQNRTPAPSRDGQKAHDSLPST